MKISVNLASHPYVELRPVYARLRTWMAILALTGIALWFLYRSERGQAQAAMDRVTTVESRVHQLESQEQSYTALMGQPKEAAILQQSDFLNGLFRSKAFSWTATMEDLENVLPSGVQVLSIDPIVAPDGHVTIRLRVTGARDRTLDLVRNLEHSQHFAAPRIATEMLATNPTSNGPGAAQPVSDTNQVNFDILADYRPLPLPSEAEQKSDEKAESRETGQASEKGGPAKAPARRPRLRKATKPSAAAPSSARAPGRATHP
jgi:type IV pilus assembly protein PilN